MAENPDRKGPSPLSARLIEQVRRNCDISDAKYGGFYSLCGFLLRLRELYIFELGLDPWRTIEKEEMSRWIDEKQRLWSGLENEDLTPLSIGDEVFDPFDRQGVNRAIAGEGLLYGAGRGLYMKPVFFVSELYGRQDIEGLDVYIAGKEYARDLSTNPAMLQGRTVFARREITRLLLREKIEELRAGKSKETLSLAFSHYGVDAAAGPPEIEDALDAAVDGEIKTYIRHEVGEAAETGRLGPLYGEMLALAKGRASVFLRAVKDTLADTSERGMLRFIIEERNEGSLGFYISFLGGQRAVLAKAVTLAFHEFLRSRNWQAVEDARAQCRKGAMETLDEATSIYRQGGDFSKKIEARFLNP